MTHLECTNEVVSKGMREDVGYIDVHQKKGQCLLIIGSIACLQNFELQPGHQK